MRWSAGQPLGQTPMVEALFDAYFAKGRDVGDVEVLAKVAAEAGYDESGARELLAGDEGRADVTREDMRARNAGITGVPCFILDGKVAVPGAVEPDVFLRVFERASHRSRRRGCELTARSQVGAAVADAS